MLESLDIGTLSASALLGIAILLVLSGLLVPRRTLTDVNKEAERWRKAYETERDARNLSDAQTKELLEVAKTTHAIVASIVTTSERIRRTGDGDAPAKT